MVHQFIYRLLLMMPFCMVHPLLLMSQTETDKAARIELTETRLIKELQEIVVSTPAPVSHNDSVYLKLKNKLEKKNFFIRKIAGLLTPDCRPSDQALKNDFESSEFYYADFEGHPIRKIQIRKVDVFGTSMNDTTQKPYLLLDRIGNKIHINTRDFVIRNNLLVKSGDRVNPFQLSYNEHIIRSLPYIQDVKFEFVKSGMLSDSVDLIVSTKDIWTLSVNYEPWALNQHRFTISHQNLIGLGRTWTSKILLKEGNAIGYANKYTIDNLMGLFLNIEFEIENSYDRKYSGLAFDRSILTPGIKWLMGGNLRTEKDDGKVVFNKSVFPNYHVNYTTYDLWLGYVEKERHNINKSVNANTIYALRARYDDYEPLERDIPGYKRFEKKTLLLASMTVQQQQFLHTRLVSTYDRTEDIPFGKLLTICGGMKLSHSSRQPYVGMQLAKGSIIRSWYAGLDMQFGSFYNNKKLEEGLFKIELNQVSPLFEKKKLKYRQFFKLSYTAGIRRLNYDSISLNDNGIRGMSSSNVYGNKRLVFNSETVVFLNKKLMSFKFAFFAFADLGLVSNNELFSWKNTYSSIGFGLRIRNENLIFKTIQLHLALYPHHPSDISPASFIVRGIERWPFNQFGFTPPTILEYN